MCKVLDIQPYVLRYWQTEFPVLAASQGTGGRREYDDEALETIRRIKELLYDEGYTIASAKKKLAVELEEGGLRGRPLAVTETQASADELSGEAELAAEEAPEDDSAREEADLEEPAGDDAPVSSPAGMADSDAGLADSDVGEIGVLNRRVVELEGGVAALVSQARKLAAELKPEMGVEDD